LDGRRVSIWPVVPLTGALAAALAYGHARLSDQAATRPGPRVALIQGSIDTEMKADPAQNERIFDEYYDLSKKALREHSDIDLIVWPETMLRNPWLVVDPDYQPPESDSLTRPEIEAISRDYIQKIVSALGVDVLFGVETYHYRRDKVDR